MSFMFCRRPAVAPVLSDSRTVPGRELRMQKANPGRFADIFSAIRGSAGRRFANFHHPAWQVSRSGGTFSFKLRLRPAFRAPVCPPGRTGGLQIRLNGTTASFLQEWAGVTGAWHEMNFKTASQIKLLILQDLPTDMSRQSKHRYYENYKNRYRCNDCSSHADRRVML